jgi:hypothetical protein
LSARRHPLVRDIALVLVVKTLLLIAGYWFFFGPDKRLDVTAPLIEAHLFSSPSGGER